MTNSKWVTISITVLCLLVALVSYRFMFLDLKLSYPDMIPHIEHRQLMFLAHIAASPLALVFGIVNLLERKKSLHRNFIDGTEDFMFSAFWSVAFLDWL